MSSNKKEELEKKILIIDDDESIRDSLRLRFKEEGFSPITIDSGQKGVDLVKENDFLLILSDIAMPDMNGYEVFRSIKKIKPEVPVVLMTAFGYDPNHSIIKSKKLGLYKWLPKPIDSDTIKSLCETAMKFYKERKRND